MSKEYEVRFKQFGDRVVFVMEYDDSKSLGPTIQMPFTMDGRTFVFLPGDISRILIPAGNFPQTLDTISGVLEDKAVAVRPKRPTVHMRRPKPEPYEQESF